MGSFRCHCRSNSMNRLLQGFACRSSCGIFRRQLQKFLTRMGFWSDTIFEGIRDAISLVSFFIIILLIFLQRYTGKVRQVIRSSVDEIRTSIWNCFQVLQFRVRHRPSTLQESRTEASTSMQNLVFASTRIYFEPVIIVRDLLEYAYIWLQTCAHTAWYLYVRRCFQYGDYFYTLPFNGFWAARQLPKER